MRYLKSSAAAAIWQKTAAALSLIATFKQRKKTMAFKYGTYSGVARDGGNRGGILWRDFLWFSIYPVGCKRFFFKDCCATLFL